jgi:hypothetical protein
MVGDRKYRHEHRRGGNHDPQNLYHALSVHLLLSGSLYYGSGSCSREALWRPFSGPFARVSSMAFLSLFS